MLIFDQVISASKSKCVISGDLWELFLIQNQREQVSQKSCSVHRGGKSRVGGLEKKPGGVRG